MVNWGKCCERCMHARPLGRLLSFWIFGHGRGFRDSFCFSTLRFHFRAQNTTFVGLSTKSTSSSGPLKGIMNPACEDDYIFTTNLEPNFQHTHNTPTQNTVAPTATILLWFCEKSGAGGNSIGLGIANMRSCAIPKAYNPGKTSPVHPRYKRNDSGNH